MLRITIAIVVAVGCSNDDGVKGDSGAIEIKDARLHPADAVVDTPIFDQPSAYIHLLEVSGFSGFQKSIVRAVLADSSLETHREQAAEGSCRLLVSNLGFCDTFCTGLCLGAGECTPFPEHQSSGDLRMEGLITTLTLEPDVQNNYTHEEYEHIFVPGQSVTVSAQGQSFSSFALSTTAPMPLLLDRMGGILEPSADSDLTITWKEPQLGSRIRLELRSDNAAHGVIAPAMLQCDLPDRGFVTVPRSLLNEFFDAEYWGCENCMPSVITRYYRTVIAVDNTDLELMNGAVQLLFLPAI